MYQTPASDKMQEIQTERKAARLQRKKQHYIEIIYNRNVSGQHRELYVRLYKKEDYHKCRQVIFKKKSPANKTGNERGTSQIFFRNTKEPLYNLTALQGRIKF